MKPAAACLALLVAACAAGQHRAVEPDAELVESFEVRLPASPYTPLASVLPQLHMLAGRVCPGRYDITDRRMQHFLRAGPTYNPTHRTVQPTNYLAAEIIATIRCLY